MKNKIFFTLLFIFGFLMSSKIEAFFGFRAGPLSFGLGDPYYYDGYYPYGYSSYPSYSRYSNYNYPRYSRYSYYR